MADLFGEADSGAADTAPRPLADRLRPQTLGEVIGQRQVLGPDAPLGVMLASGSLSSLIFWGHPVLGKPQSRGSWRRKPICISFRSRRFLLACLSCAKSLRRPRSGAQTGRARCCLSTRSTVLTKPSRTDFCHIWRMERSSWWARPRKTPASS